MVGWWVASTPASPILGVLAQVHRALMGDPVLPVYHWPCVPRYNILGGPGAGEQGACRYLRSSSCIGGATHQVSAPPTTTSPAELPTGTERYLSQSKSGTSLSAFSPMPCWNLGSKFAIHLFSLCSMLLNLSLHHLSLSTIYLPQAIRHLCQSSITKLIASRSVLETFSSSLEPVPDLLGTALSLALPLENTLRSNLANTLSCDQVNSKRTRFSPWQPPVPMAASTCRPTTRSSALLLPAAR